MRERPALFLGLLADQPELIAEVGALRWRASGGAGTPGPWIEAAARRAGRDRLPISLVAMGLDGGVIGALTLSHTSDGRDPDDAPGEPAAGADPWLVELVVRDDERRCGVGRLMIGAAEAVAREQGYRRVRVAAPTSDADFYLHCGWHPEVEPGTTTDGPPGIVLVRDLTVDGSSR